MYRQQDDGQPQDNLRCQMRMQADCRFELVSIRPKLYFLPTDSPIG